MPSKSVQSQSPYSQATKIVTSVNSQQRDASYSQASPLADPRGHSNTACSQSQNCYGSYSYHKSTSFDSPINVKDINQCMVQMTTSNSRSKYTTNGLFKSKSTSSKNGLINCRSKASNGRQIRSTPLTNGQANSKSTSAANGQINLRSTPSQNRLTNFRSTVENNGRLNCRQTLITNERTDCTSITSSNPFSTMRPDQNQASLQSRERSDQLTDDPCEAVLRSMSKHRLLYLLKRCTEQPSHTLHESALLGQRRGKEGDSLEEDSVDEKPASPIVEQFRPLNINLH